MATLRETTVRIEDATGREVAFVRLSLLPDARDDTVPPLLTELHQSDQDDPCAPVQLLEGTEYRFEFEHIDKAKVISTDKREVFQPDSYSGRTGRVRPGLYVGTLPVRVFANGEELGRFEVEVRSRKLDYLADYRWMLRDIAEQLTELVMDRFAVSLQRFTLDDTRDAITLYERFCFLRSLITGEDFRAAVARILGRPHVAYLETHEPVSPGQGLRADSYSTRQLSRPGARTKWLTGPVPTVPLVIDRRRTHASVDTTPNRFVKFALERWREVLAGIAAALEAATPTEASRRGAREVGEVLEELDALLASELFRELSDLNRFPADDQVLQKREGYRDVYRAYVQFELAARLCWHAGYEVFGAGQRDVAVMYEYWAFFQIATILGRMLKVPFDSGDLIELTDNALNVRLKAGTHCVLKGEIQRLGRSLAVELWFNRTFSRGNGREGSWSRSLRPDYSVVLSPGRGEIAQFDPVVLHFDAKYRVEHVEDLFGSIEEEANQPEARALTSPGGEVLRTDLLKMHAYRDAIRRSVGAYVVYPGSKHEVLYEYHELLPGLGAFALRPSHSGAPYGTDALGRFLNDVMDHVSLQISQHERGRYWLRQAYSESTTTDAVAPAADFLSAPPADTLVLLGFVRDESHWHWIESMHRYNLRAGDRRGAVELGNKELACELIVLSCPALRRTAITRVVSKPEIHTREEMAKLDYPNPRGSYFCFAIEFLADPEWSELLSSLLIEKIRAEHSGIRGMPVVITWQELAVRVGRISPGRPMFGA